MKFYLVVIAPYVFSIFLLFVPNTYGRSFAAGIATVTAVVLAFWEGFLFVLLVLNLVFFNSPSMLEPGSPPPGSTTVVVLASLLCHVVVVVSSIILMVRASRGVPVFVLGVILGGCYADGVYGALERSQANYDKALEDVDKESTAAFNTVESISWCAIEYASAHPDEGYPASLNAISGNPVCKRSWSLTAIPHYSVSFTSSREDSGKVTAFSVNAVAPPNPLRAPKNAESDQSGIALIEHQDPRDTRYPVEVGTVSPLSSIWENKICFRDYATDHPALGFPRSFFDAPKCSNAFRQYGSRFLSDTAVRLGYYLYDYSPSAPDRSGIRRSYRLSVTCEVYGTLCLHSFLLTNDGRVFVTSANRAATLEDTLLSPCPRGGLAPTFCRLN